MNLAVPVPRSKVLFDLKYNGYWAAKRYDFLRISFWQLLESRGIELVSWFMERGVYYRPIARENDTGN